MSSPAYSMKAAVDQDVETESNSHSVDFTEADEKKVVRKIDLKLLPILTILYLLSFLDRSNIGLAKLDGLVTDLKITDYATVSSIFFVGYIVAEVPANIILKKTSPPIWLPTLTLLWGIVTVVQGLVHNQAGMYAVRFFLGVTEAGLFPGITYFFSCYYKREERVWRVSLFFSAAAAAGAFGGALAYALGLMRGVGGKPGWFWIFALEGMLTVVVSVIAYFVIPTYPEKSTHFTEKEKKIIHQRLIEDSDALDEEPFSWDAVKDAFKDKYIYLYSLLFHGFAFPLYSSSLYLPTIIQGLGYKSWEAQLLTVPPYILAFIYTMTLAYLSKIFARRAIFILSSVALSILGYIVLITAPTSGGQYVGVFLALSGIYSGNALLLAWPSENILGQTKRATGLAMVIGLGDIGAIVGTQLYRKPLGSLKNTRFRVSHGLAIVWLGIAALAASLLWYLMSRDNKRRDAEAAATPEKKDLDLKYELQRTGDREALKKLREREWRYRV